MRLADFILANGEPILAEWESFARSIWPRDDTDVNPAELRDHADDILRATARDMQSSQTSVEQTAKSKGEEDGGTNSQRMLKASAMHASDRLSSGFGLMA